MDIYDPQLKREVEVEEIKELDTSVTVDPALIKKILDNITRIEIIARMASDPETWAEADLRLEELEKELGIPIYIDENVDREYPALVINSERAYGSRIFCWLDLDSKRRVEFYEEVVYRFPA